MQPTTNHQPPTTPPPNLLAPVSLHGEYPDAVGHSLAILSTIYHYNHWIFSAVRDHLGDRVLEVGAGIGNITRFLLDTRELTCIEPDPAYREYLARRFEKHLNVRVLPYSVEQCPNADVAAGSLDAVVCLNVLEHIPDDAAVLRRFHELLVPGGRAVVLVPAMPWAYGVVDKAMGHVRRYTRRSLTRLFVEAGFTVTHQTYMNLAGLFGWWWHGRVRGIEKIPEAGTRMFDRYVPVISAVERLLPPPIGQSLVVVGRKG